jgi:hypothetical protein
MIIYDDKNILENGYTIKYVTNALKGASRIKYILHVCLCGSNSMLRLRVS